ncbi:MAG: SusC/RagA family protein, partial [Bacteroidetes bacterium]|nr:SusC/RagA family protein [Candidatus Egerieousia excrementavium]
FFQGVGKRDLWNNSFLGVPGYNASDGAMPQTFADFWYETFDSDGKLKDANYDAFYPRATNMGTGQGFNNLPNDRLLLNMAYLRLKNVTLGYTLPKQITQKAYISKLRVYVSLENFLTFDKLNGLPIDPEAIPGVSYFNSSNYNNGRVGVGVPAMKTASVGLQITF